MQLAHSTSRMGHDLHQCLQDAWWCGLVGEDDLLDLVLRSRMAAANGPTQTLISVCEKCTSMFLVV